MDLGLQTKSVSLISRQYPVRPSHWLTPSHPLLALLWSDYSKGPVKYTEMF